MVIFRQSIHLIIISYKLNYLRLSRIKNIINNLKNEFLFVTLTNITSFLGSIILVVIISRNLELNEFGIYGLSLTVTTIFFQILYGPLSNGFQRFLPLSIDLRSEKSFMYGNSKIWINASLIVFVNFFAALPIIYYLNKFNWIYLTILIFFFTIASSIFELNISYFHSQRKRKKVLELRIIENSIKILLLLFFVPTSPEIVLLLFSIAYCLLIFLYPKILISILTYRKNLRTKYWEKKTKIYMKPFMIWGVFNWVQLNSAKWFLEILDNTSNVGLYNGLFQIGYTSIILIGSTIISFVTPIFFEKTNLSGKSTLNLNKLFNYIIYCSPLLLGIVFIIFYFFSDILIMLILGDKFIEVSDLLPIVAIAATLFSLSNLIATFTFTKNRPNSMMFPNIFSSIIGTIITFFLIHKFSIEGAVAALVVFNIIYISLTIINTKKTLIN